MRATFAVEGGAAARLQEMHAQMRETQARLAGECACHREQEQAMSRFVDMMRGQSERQNAPIMTVTESQLLGFIFSPVTCTYETRSLHPSDLILTSVNGFPTFADIATDLSCCAETVPSALI